VSFRYCTAALYPALEAVGLRPGVEVIVPTRTFAAAPESAPYFGAKPVLVYVRASDHNVAAEPFPDGGA
jgi:dTDP-4-amino-4,6-dideoxygalactose transaminase